MTTRASCDYASALTCVDNHLTCANMLVESAGKSGMMSLDKNVSEIAQACKDSGITVDLEECATAEPQTAQAIAIAWGLTTWFRCCRSLSMFEVACFFKWAEGSCIDR